MRPVLAPALVLLACTAAAAAAAVPGWSREGVNDGIEVFTRQREGARVREVKVVGAVEAPPPAVFRALTDYPRYVETMPFTREARVVATEEGGRVVHFYTRVAPPVISPRDYTMRMVHERAPPSKGPLRISWTPSDRGPPPIEKVVRITVNAGYWLLEPLDGGRRTRATYVLLTDPGGGVPGWMADRANRQALPDLLKGLRKAARDPRYAETRPPPAAR